MTKSALLNAFENIIKQFNACSKKGDYRANFKDLLHPNIVISKVDDLSPPPTAFTTIEGVLSYLEANQTDKFPRISQSTAEETPADSSSSTYAQVSGTATYKDKSADLSGFGVRYFFSFSRDVADDSYPWLLISACAAKVSS